MRTIDDPAVIVRIVVGLSAKLEAEVFDDICISVSTPHDCKEKGRLTGGRAAEGRGNTAEVDDDSLDTISFAFDFGLDALHLVAVEWVGDILELVSSSRYMASKITHPTNIDGSHDWGCF